MTIGRLFAPFAVLVLVTLAFAGFLAGALTDSHQELSCVRTAIEEKDLQWIPVENEISRMDPEIRRALLGALPEELQGAPVLEGTLSPNSPAVSTGETSTAQLGNHGEKSGRLRLLRCLRGDRGTRGEDEYFYERLAVGPEPLGRAHLRMRWRLVLVGLDGVRCHEFSRGRGGSRGGVFPLCDLDASCSETCADWEDHKVEVRDWAWVSNSQSALKTQLSEGPLTTTMDVYTDFFYYGSGVYEHAWGSYEGGHCITLIGWDDSQGCWICKNSWGGDGARTAISKSPTATAGSVLRRPSWISIP